MNDSLDRRGLFFGFSAYFVWGLFPILMAALAPASALEIVAHRSLWSLVVCLLIFAVAKGWRRLTVLFRDRPAMIRLTFAALLIGSNWGVMVYAVLTDRVSATSLGYYINPLLTVGLSVLVLGERLRRLQLIAIVIAAVAVVVVAVDQGGVPWISLVLACSFAVYALTKKGIGRTVDALTGLTAETLVLLPIALGILAWTWNTDARTFLTRGAEGLTWWHDVMMVGTGVWTAGALLLFAAGARRLPLNITGLLQYLTPTMTFVLAVTYFGEDMSPLRWVGFSLVWVALTIITMDSWRARPGGRRRREASVEPAEPA